MPATNFDTIFCPPVNSSGDIYHIAAYLIICRTLNYVVPQVILFYDTDDTQLQANRGKDFLSGLSFTNVRSIRLESKSYQAKPRQSLSATAVESYSASAVDQKITTSLISFAIVKHGAYINTNINKHIADIGLKPNARPAASWAMTEVAKISKKLQLNKHRFVIINLRVSITANSEQALSEIQLVTLAKKLAQHNIRMILFDVGGTQGKIFAAKHASQEYAKSIALNVFPIIDNLSVKYGKFTHIFLLQEFAKLKNFSGVIGNTSGTLDIAAFMGLRTLCIHRFKTSSSRNVLVPYQDLRILLQSNLMSIYDHAAGLEKMEKLLSLWLTSKHHLLWHIQTNMEKISLEVDKFKLKHCDRSCFALNTQNKLANSVFPAQHSQLQCDQKLSLILSRHLTTNNNSTQTTPFKLINDNPHAQDDFNLEKNTKRRPRRSSMPSL